MTGRPPTLPTTDLSFLDDDPRSICELSNAEFADLAETVVEIGERRSAAERRYLGILLAEAYDRYRHAGTPDRYKRLEKELERAWSRHRSTLWQWRAEGEVVLGLRERPPARRAARQDVEVIEANSGEVISPESSAAVPTTVSEHGPDAGEGFVALPGSGQQEVAGSLPEAAARDAGAQAGLDTPPGQGPATQDSTSAGGTNPTGADVGGVSATREGAVNAGSTGPSYRPQNLEHSTPSPPVQTPECGPQGASAVKGPELVEPPSPEVAELSGGSVPQPPPSPRSATSGPSRPVGAAGRSASARPAGPSVAEIEAALALICEASDTAITNVNEFLKAKAVQKLGGPQLIDRNGAKSSNGTNPRPFAGPIPKVGKK